MLESSVKYIRSRVFEFLRHIKGSHLSLENPARERFFCSLGRQTETRGRGGRCIATIIEHNGADEVDDTNEACI